MNRPNPLFKQVIFQRVWNHLKENQPGKKISNYDVAKEFYKLRVTVTHLFKDAVLIVLGIFSASFGLEGFLLPNSFIDGGVTGISLLVAVVSQFSLPVLIMVINLPFMIMGYKQISRSFAIK
ncbi:MAG: YitT family protein, partial [Cyclobacteriaceae bacterium]